MLNEDLGEEIPQEQKKILTHYSKHWKEIKEKGKKKWIRDIALITLLNNKERLALVPIQNDQMPQFKRW